jgi:hypothetical protein
MVVVGHPICFDEDDPRPMLRHLDGWARRFLLIAPDGVVRFVLESLLLDLHEPIVRWRPNEPLTLPRPDEGGTLVLRDIGAMTTDDQLRLVDWLDRAKGRTQVVSTSSGPVLPRVHSGGFIERLYYRLNTVCVDVTPS